MPDNGFPVPPNEEQRLRALREYAVLDSLPEQAYDDLTILASAICDTPIALITLLDEDRQWFKGNVGLEASETPRSIAFCSHAIMNPEEVMVVEDAEVDDRFAANPLVTGDPHIRFYAGAPLVTPTGESLGTICVIDREPRKLTAVQSEALKILSRAVIAQLELRRSIATLEQAVLEQEHHVALMREYQQNMERVRADLESQSRTDALTGIRNRRSFDIQLEEECERAQNGHTPCSLVLIDTDQFKEINDRFGHPAGDETLRAVALLLQSALRSDDVLCRYGGDEFGAILPGTTATAAFIIAERCRRTIERAAWPRRAVTVSLGVASTDATITSAPDLLDAADYALRDAKQTGRNRVSMAVAENLLVQDLVD